MAITPEKARNYIETIDYLEQIIDESIIETPEIDKSVTIGLPVGFHAHIHFNQVKAMYLQAGWKDVILLDNKLKFVYGE